MGAFWAETATETPTRRRGPLSVVVELVVITVVAVGLALVVKTFLVQPFYIPSVSMEPGLKVNDRILAEKPSYWMGGTPQRGDVVVFSDPGGWLGPAEERSVPRGVAGLLARVGLYPTGGHLVKRVIGVAGDTVVCCDHGRISVNGHALSESGFVAAGNACDGPMQQEQGTVSGGCKGWKAVVPRGRLFVMGDNRGDSADSSYHLCGPAKQAADDPSCDNAFVPVHDVVGRVVVVMWPWRHISVEHRPATFADVS